MIEVVEPGLHSTVQDRGRIGWGHLGVRRAGAADPLAHAVANLLVGNEPGAAALEMTLLGGTFVVRGGVLVGLAGADMGATALEEGRPLLPGGSYRLRDGTTIAFGSATDGARTYLALAGGIAVPTALGSASTDPVAGFGGIEGRPLRAGDRLALGASADVGERCWPAGEASSGVGAAGAPAVLGVVKGPHLEGLPATATEALAEQVWTVSTHADRVGLRLEGSPIAGAETIELVSQPMLPGAIQLPPNGQPIVLMPDAPTVGGYPVPAVLAEVDRHVAGQLRPGDGLSFEWIELDDARMRSRAEADRIAVIAATLA